MSVSVLLEKLVDIQRSVGIETNSVVKHKLMDAQEYLLAMEKERLGSHNATSEPKAAGIPELFSHIYSRS